MDTPQTTTEAPMDVTTSSSTDSSLAISTRPTSDSDPASSLRAAALLTLKTKRRKVVPASHAENPTPTTRPPPPDNQLQLDYGQDDTTPLSGGVPDSAKRPSAVIVPSASNLEDGQAREEGEISDEEDQSSPPSVSIKPKTSGSNVQYARARSPASDVKMVKPQPSTPPRQAPPTETLSANSPSNWSSDNIGYAAQNSVPAQPTMDPAYIRHVLSMVDEDHVRPGLTMNQTQYDHAKDIILDLLGWGVTPEHLVEYGLSREIIYYTFNELNLRLPENLATADLVPYPPYPEMLSYPPPHQPSEPTPLRFHTNGRASSKDRSSSPQDFIAPVPSAALSGHPSSSTSTENLHDIERQRRQELLARKAVQASRKSKQNQTLPDLQLEAKVSKDSVDDFLKAITSTSLSRQNSLEMDVDDAHYSSTDVLNMPIDPPESSSSNSSSPLASTPQSPRNLPNATASSATSDSTPTDDIRILRQTVENSVSQRRGQKRPVASDFVDFDAVPRGNGTTHSKQRKTRAGFAGHGAVRRFVIDISDSEGDDEIYAREPVGGEQDVKNGRLPFGQSRPIPQSATVPNAHRDPQGSSSVGVMSPASLVQKELEIQRMRELIAQREQKLAAAKSSSKLDLNETPAPGSQAVLITPVSPNRETSVEPEGQTQADPANTSREQTNPPEEQASTTTIPGTHLLCQPFSMPFMSGTLPTSKPLGVEDEHSQLINRPSDTTTLHISRLDEPVDVDMAPSSSTQVSTMASVPPRPDEKQDPSTDSSTDKLKFVNYDSPFRLYPTLRMRSMVSERSFNYRSSDFSSTDISGSSPLLSLVSSNSIPFLDLSLLRLTTMAKWLDPSKQICQYEIPGGGECRDGGCTDLHLSRLGFGSGKTGGELSDNDVADFLVDTLPPSWLAEHDVTRAKILNSLEQVRIKKPDVLLEGRVKEALSALGPLPLAT